MKKGIVLLSVVFLSLSGCETTSCTYLEFKNTTQQQLYVELFYGSDKILRGLPLDIQAGYQRSFWVNCAEGGVPVVYPDLVGIDSIHIYSSGIFSKGFNIRTEGKNPFLEKYWMQKTTHRSGGGSNTTSTFIITSHDVEAWQ